MVFSKKLVFVSFLMLTHHPCKWQKVCFCILFSPTFHTHFCEDWIPAFHSKYYHIECILNRILKALNEPPRKLHYNSVVSFLRYNRPLKFQSSQEEFLYHCFDLEGNFTKGAVAWMLFRFDVLRMKDGVKFKKLENDLFPPMDDEDLKVSMENFLAKSKEANENEAVKQQTTTTTTTTTTIESIFLA